ncbi:HSPB1 associated protein 1 [Leptinotarsa decemlineata]|uniref:HSPB1 associated protein 1 n=1 Tax=Leptinotarsa decemlineata TaxID=7539 RepID=UPI003D306E27
MSDKFKSDIKYLILNSKHPLVFKNYMKWALLNWSLEDWKKNIGNEKMTFRSGLYQSTVEPQWERKSKLFNETFDFFIEQSLTNSTEWFYFDYKYLNDCLKEVNDLRNEIHWDPLGFPEIKSEDCTIWIGSKGAHTPCHYDSYGCNLVYQIYGKKLWMLFSPEENLRPSRIPYEESSVYSKLNFFSPNLENFRSISGKCKKVVLTPGDVLLVPNKWWHYVENLETSISINVWLPLPQDDEERLKEAVVQFFVKQISESSNSTVNNLLLNPNMEDIILQANGSSVFLDMINSCKSSCQRKELQAKKAKFNTEAAGKADTPSLPEIFQKYSSFIEVIRELPKEDFYSFMESQKNRFRGSIIQKEAVSLSSSDENVIEIFNVLTDMEVIDLIKNKILEKKSA